MTGGIATGKSKVLERFGRRGVPCLDADVLARGVMSPGTEATQAIAERFGADLLSADGTVDRGKLASIVFAEASARRDLEAIVHPAVYRAIAAGLRAFELIGGSRLAMADVPLLYETGHAGDFDRVVATVCSPAAQLARLAARGLSPAEAEQRLGAQMAAEEKAARADFAITTDGTLEETDAQVERVWRQLLALSA